MKFGKVPITQLDTIDFKLPDFVQVNDHKISPGDLQIIIGAPAWGIKTWVGQIYPPGTRTSDYLKYYAQQFKAIELNTMFYRAPTLDIIESWLSVVPNDFLFCPKVTQSIAKFGQMKNKKEVDEFINVVQELGTNLGIVFLQLGEEFSPTRIKDLQTFIDLWDKSIPLAVELRHPQWFKNGELIIADYLSANNVSAVVTDVPGRRDVLHKNITSDFLMIRFNGNMLHKTDYTRVDSWVEKIIEFRESRVLNRLFFFIHQPDEINCPEMADYLIKKLDAKGFDLPELKFYDQPSLF